MAHQEEGWPLGLQPLKLRTGSISFSTMLTNSSSTFSTDFSSDLDTESTGSYSNERSITLGSLIGVSNILELSRRSMRRGRREEPLKSKKPYNCRTWLFSHCCSRHCTDVIRNPPSLGHFLDVERRAAAMKETQNSITQHV
ncbi:hypothetical protein V2J09_018180 [Rumex salicifolius]